MTVSQVLSQIQSTQTVRQDQELSVQLGELIRQLNANVTQTNDDITDASNGGDLKTFGVSTSAVWRSDDAGVFPAGDPTEDKVVVFNTDGVQVATRTIRGSLTSSSGDIEATDQASTGEATTINIVNDNTDSVRVDVTHTASGAIATASFSSVDQSIAGLTPVSGGSK